MRVYTDEPSVYGLVRDIFMALAITCLLTALHRIASALLLQGRVMAYEEFETEMAPEEREILIHRVIKAID